MGLPSTLSSTAPIRIANAGQCVLVSHGHAIRADARTWADPKYCEELFAERKQGLIVGSVPYRAMQGEFGLFHCKDPVWTQRHLTTPGAPPLMSAASRPRVESLRESPNREQFLQIVRHALAEIEGSKLEKVVLSRSHHLKLSAPVDPSWLYSRLLHKHHQGFVYQVPYLHQHRLGVLVGASPELLIAKRGTIITSTPLAGSMPRSSDPEENERRAARLLCSRKDLHEHALVVEHIRAGLSPLCSELQIPAHPSVVATPTMLHLGTTIRGELSSGNRAQHALALALKLHPTPALCGVPRDQAESVIDQMEPENREFYGGTVGWMNALGDGEWAVTIRCAHLESDTVRLQAGVGIVRGSSPELELLETDAKLQTMLRALGLAPQPEPRNTAQRPSLEAHA